MSGSPVPKPKRRRWSTSDPMEDERAKPELATTAEELGWEIRVFKTSPDSSSTDEASATFSSQNDEPDDFYDFTPDDYYEVVSNKVEAQFLKTCKMREAEEASRRSRMKKAVVRVKFPDGYVLEADFQPSESIQSLMDLLSKVIACPDLPFYVYTAPPKERIKDMTKDFYSFGFSPGAIVYFTYDMPEDIDAVVSPPYLRDEIRSRSDLHVLPQDHPGTDNRMAETTAAPVEPPPPVVPEHKPASKPRKPKWFKM